MLVDKVCADRPSDQELAWVAPANMADSVGGNRAVAVRLQVVDKVVAQVDLKRPAVANCKVVQVAEGTAVGIAAIVEDSLGCTAE